MKLKDLVTISRNKNNNQTNLSIKKNKLKELQVSEDALLDLRIEDFERGFFK